MVVIQLNEATTASTIRIPAVRQYTHWTQVALAFGGWEEKQKARRWLKRQTRRLRKARRGWA
jgi:hypothetical protein